MNIVVIQNMKPYNLSFQFCNRQDTVGLDSVKPPPDIISIRMTSPNITTSLDTERLAFTRYENDSIIFTLIHNFIYFSVMVCILVSMHKILFD